MSCIECCNIFIGIFKRCLLESRRVTIKCNYNNSHNICRNCDSDIYRNYCFSLWEMHAIWIFFVVYCIVTVTKQLYCLIVMQQSNKFLTTFDMAHNNSTQLQKNHLSQLRQRQISQLMILTLRTLTNKPTNATVVIHLLLST